MSEFVYLSHPPVVGFRERLANGRFDFMPEAGVCNRDGRIDRVRLRQEFERIARFPVQEGTYLSAQSKNSSNARISRHPKEVRLRLRRKMIRIGAQRDFGRILHANPNRLNQRI
jgi:hypothetical protein